MAIVLDPLPVPLSVLLATSNKASEKLQPPTCMTSFMNAPIKQLDNQMHIFHLTLVTFLNDVTQARAGRSHFCHTMYEVVSKQ